MQRTGNRQVVVGVMVSTQLICSFFAFFFTAPLTLVPCYLLLLSAVHRPHATATDRPLAYGVVFLRLGGGLGCFSPAIDNYIEKRHCVWPHQRLLHRRLYLEQLAMAA